MDIIYTRNIHTAVYNAYSMKRRYCEILYGAAMKRKRGSTVDCFTPLPWNIATEVLMSSRIDLIMMYTAFPWIFPAKNKPANEYGANDILISRWYVRMNTNYWKRQVWRFPSLSRPTSIFENKINIQALTRLLRWIRVSILLKYISSNK